MCITQNTCCYLLVFNTEWTNWLFDAEKYLQHTVFHSGPTSFLNDNGGKSDCRPFSMAVCSGIQPHPSAPCHTFIVPLRPQQYRVLTAQRVAVDGIRVSDEVRRETVDRQTGFRQKDTRAGLFPSGAFEGRVQQHRKGGDALGFARIYLD